MTSAALIDPYWNVNGLNRKERLRRENALIDPYWNVNVQYAAADGMDLPL